MELAGSDALTARARAHLDAGRPLHAVPALVESERAHIPLGRFGRTGEVAPTAALLCTEQSSYTSGAVFVVDGASDCV